MWFLRILSVEPNPLTVCLTWAVSGTNGVNGSSASMTSRPLSSWRPARRTTWSCAKIPVKTDYVNPLTFSNPFGITGGSGRYPLFSFLTNRFEIKKKTNNNKMNNMNQSFLLNIDFFSAGFAGRKSSSWQISPGWILSWLFSLRHSTGCGHWTRRGRRGLLFTAPITFIIILWLMNYYYS